MARFAGTAPLAARLPVMTENIAYLGLLDDEAIVLDLSALELAALDHVDVDLSSYVDRLGELTEQLMMVGGSARSATERAVALAKILGGENGFVGDADTYDDPANADLIRVIDRRCGLPVSLSILYVSLARRLGWSAHALNTPGHVLVRLGPEAAPVLIDPFHGGAMVEHEQLSLLLSQMVGQRVILAAEHLLPMSNRAVLVRLLMNQASRAEAAGDAERALILYGRMTVIAPAYGQTWWDRARLEASQGQSLAARGSLMAMMEITRDPIVRAHISAALDTLA